jgi:predicted nucleotidyltransferase
MRLVRIPVERFVKWIETLRIVEEYAVKLQKTLGRVTVILFGSYARGDYNVWSDIDIIVISEYFTGRRILDRYDLIPEAPPGVEPILLSPSEFISNLEKASFIEMLRDGAVVITDDYRLTDIISKKSIKAKNLSEMRMEIRRLMNKYAG